MVSRRDLYRQSGDPATGAVAQQVEPHAPEAVRTSRPPIYPPGAVSDFRWKCTGCGDCISVCPVDALKQITHPLSDRQVPVIVPTRAACTMCEDLPCVTSCEEGALRHPAGDRFPTIGTAHIDQGRCLAFNGTPCYTCYDACPLKLRAITMRNNRPGIVATECTGCGLCEQACVLHDEKAVQILPLTA